MNLISQMSPRNKKLAAVFISLLFASIFLIVLFGAPTQVNLNEDSISDLPAANYNKYYSAYYDLLYKDKNYEKEVSYLDSLIKKFHSSYNTDKMKILELGCGTGKHAFLLHKNFGYAVHGTDMSREMIQQANTHYGSVSNQLTFSVGDARRYRDPARRMFDVVLSLFHVVSYQTTNQDILNEFETAAKHTKKGGLFIFDVWYGPTVLTDRPTTRTKVMENDEIKVKRFASPEFHPNSNVVDVNYKIEVEDKKTNELNTFEEKHPMRFLFKPELELMLELKGFNLLTYEEWVSGKEPGFDTWGVTFIALKI